MNDLQEKADAKAAAVLNEAVATYVTTSPVALADTLNSFHVTISQAINTIWEKELSFGSTTPPPVYSPWQEGVSFDVERTTPMVEDDVRAREIESRLNALGGDPKAVATSLRKQDIVGYVGSPSGCAIAQWLKKNFEGYGAVSVGPAAIHLLATDGVHLRITTPAPVRSFIRLFDGSAFPELVAGGRFRYPGMGHQDQDLVKFTTTKGEDVGTVPSSVPKFVPGL